MSNVIEFNRNALYAKNDFTPHEKTLLGDIAMDYRTQGLNIRLFENGCPRCPVARFVDVSNNKQYMIITKCRTEAGHFEYRISPIGRQPEVRLNFPDVVSLCNNHILDMATNPDVSSVPAQKFG